jgi:hypothetical protein
VQHLLGDLAAAMEHIEHGDPVGTGDVLIGENLAHPLICGKYSCPRRESWCPLVPNADE